jgi:hypothetical protein
MTELLAVGQNAWDYANAGRSNATVADSLPGLPGTGVDALLQDHLPSSLRTYPEMATHIALNWGVNDMNAWPLNQATWISQYGQIIAYLHSRFPNAVFYLSYPWRVGFDAIAATMHGWVDTVIANALASGIQCFPGVDEAITIKASDNGFLETDISEGGSGVHYTNPLGVGLYAAAMRVVLAS